MPLSFKLILVATGTEPLAQAVATQGTDATEKYLKLLSELLQITRPLTKPLESPQDRCSAFVDP